VTVELDASPQSEVKKGHHAQITLPPMGCDGILASPLRSFTPNRRFLVRSRALAATVFDMPTICSG
jgi:hypothetical protein